MSAGPAPSPFRVELGATLRLAGPLALANMLQMAVYAVDVIFVARLGPAALAASSLAIAIFSLINFGFLGLTGAVAAVISAERGRKTHAVREIRRSARMALWLAVMGGVLGMALCQFGESFMLLTGQDPHTSQTAGGFLSLLSLSLIPLLLSNVLRMFVSAMGRPVFATFVTAFAIAVNALGNWALIFGHFGLPALGLAGSALSTLLTGIATTLAYALAIRWDRQLRRYHVFGRLWRPEWRRLREILVLGVPIALTVVAEGGLFSSAAFLMGRIGETQLAAHTIALQIAAFFFQVPFGVGQAATIRVGYHYGARDTAAAGHAGWAAVLVCLAFAGVSASAMLLFPRLILSAYLDVTAPVNALLVGFAVQYLAVAAAFQLVDGAQAVAAGALRGLQDTRVPMIVAIAGYWLVGFTIAIALGFATSLAGVGVWIGLAAGLTAVAIALMWRWRQRGRLGLLPAPSQG
jgi:MATE family multidrug resistance protein